MKTNRIDRAYSKIKKMHSKLKAKSHILFELEKVAER